MWLVNIIHADGRKEAMAVFKTWDEAKNIVDIGNDMEVEFVPYYKLRDINVGE